ncbi:MAG: FAD-dependent monooxygenase [Rhodobiaceae bacterium]|nr:FAD-dependent monooxygenase [Rhodobiaceae bacterium]MCC0055935.1 FAD-dependent monooxygenase [Rhodobiaceae bacterium]
MRERRRILIAGGGIAGLSVALAAAEAGFSPEVFEQAGRIEEFGAGLQITPNASAALTRLGFGDDLAERAYEPANIHLISHTGGTLWSAPLGQRFAQSWGHPYRVMHRADLIGMLSDAAYSHPDISLRLNHRAEGFATHAHGVTLMAGSPGNMDDFHGAGLIGTDGLHSVIRRWVVGDGDAKPSGYVAWRSVADAGAAIDPRLKTDVCVWVGPRAHVVTYPLRRGSIINIVAVTEGSLDDPGWNAPAEPTLVVRRFVGWPPPLMEVVEAAPSWRRWRLADRRPADTWGQGPVVLAGDAAHPVMPFAGQGAALALEDAATLGHFLKTEASVESAFARFRNARRKRAAAIWSFSRRNGFLYHSGGLIGFARDIALRGLPDPIMLDRQWWIYDWRPFRD